jgi:hypothetical protein
MVINGFDVQLRLFAVKVTLRLTVGQSVCLSSCRAPAGAHDHMFLFARKLLSCPYGAPSLTRGRICHLSVIVDSISQLSVVHIFTNLQLLNNCTIYTRPLSVQAQYSSFRYNGSLVTWTVVCLTAKFKPLILWLFAVGLSSGFVPVKNLWIILWFGNNTC